MVGWTPLREYGPHLSSCWPRSNWIMAGVTERCTCGHSLDTARGIRDYAAVRAAAQRERRRSEAQREAALTAAITPVIADLEQARAQKDWPAVDAITASLKQQSITVQVTKQGIRWYR